VCQLYGNELHVPLRHLFQYLDKSTTWPRAFSGPTFIGKALSKC